jgi:hypothetical protein
MGSGHQAFRLIHHAGSDVSFARRRIQLTVLCLGLLFEPLSLAAAGEGDRGDEKNRVDTEFIFGFTAGADVGELGERELEHQTNAQWGKCCGTYAALTDQLRYETSPVPNFRFEIGAPIAYYDISGISGLEDRNQAVFNGITTEFRYQLLNRDSAPFSLTLSAEPHWSRTDEISGARVDNYGGELSLVLDKELVKDRLFAALNVVYDPEISRSAGQWERDSMLALTTAVTTQVRPGVFVGAEARYLRRYDGIELDSLSGQAFFLGPTTFVRFSKSLAVSAAWSIQLAGHGTAVPGVPDLTGFTRQQALLRVEYNF